MLLYVQSRVVTTQSGPLRFRLRKRWENNMLWLRRSASVSTDSSDVPLCRETSGRVQIFDVAVSSTHLFFCGFFMYLTQFGNKR